MIPKFNLHEKMVLNYVRMNIFGNKFLYCWLDTRYPELTIEFLDVAFYIFLKLEKFEKI